MRKEIIEEGEQIGVGINPMASRFVNEDSCVFKKCCKKYKKKGRHCKKCPKL
jgi:predicted transcriptional regulator